MITEFSWTALYGPEDWLPGQTLHLAINASVGDHVGFISSRIESRPVKITEENVQGMLGGAESFETGAVIWGGEMVCAQTQTALLYPGGGLVTQVRGIRNVNVRGRLVPDPGAG